MVGSYIMYKVLLWVHTQHTDFFGHHINVYTVLQQACDHATNIMDKIIMLLSTFFYIKTVWTLK